MALAAVALALSPLLGCSREPAPPIRIAINPWPGYEFLYLAGQKGFFAEEGVSVRFIEHEALADSRRAFELGQVDGLCCTLVEVLQAYNVADRLAQVVYVTDYSDGADMILAQPEIETVAGLRGKRVAAELGTLNVYVLARALETVGLTLDDVQVVPMAQSGMPRAFEQREVDAAVIYPPESVAVLRGGKARTLFTSMDIPGEVVDVLAFDAGFIAKRGDDIARILRAYDRAFRYAAEHPDEAYPVMAQREGISVEELRDALTTGIHLVTFDKQGPFFVPGGTLEKDVQAVEAVLRRVKQIERTAPAAQYVSGKPLEKAARP